MSLYSDIKTLLMEFDHESYGVNLQHVDEKWEDDLAGQLTTLLAVEINRAVLNTSEDAK